MANRLDEVTGVVNDSGRETRVIDTQIPVKTGIWSLLFEIFIWAIGFVLAGLVIVSAGSDMPIIAKAVIILLAFVPGIILVIAKINAKKYFSQLEQEIQAQAAEIGQYQKQRLEILKNVASLVEKSITLDKEVMETVAAYRGGVDPAKIGESLDHSIASLFPHIENYPELKAHAQIAEAMRQNSELEQEIRAARELYNAKVLQWNQDIFEWPIKMIVAAREGYTTRIPYSISKDRIEGSEKNFFA